MKSLAKQEAKPEPIAAPTQKPASPEKLGDPTRSPLLQRATPFGPPNDPSAVLSDPDVGRIGRARTMRTLQATMGNGRVTRMLAATRTGRPNAGAQQPLALHRTAGDAAVASFVRRQHRVQRQSTGQHEPEQAVSTAQDVLLEPLPVSPPQVRVIGTYTDEQISMELYGRPGVPIKFLTADSVEVVYSTLVPKWKPAFRETASEWEKSGAEQLEKVGYERDGKIVWQERLRWRPVEDPRRGGMVVAYMRSSGGYTEVRNTAGEVVFVDEIGIESVHIPIVDDIGAVLKQAGYVVVGVADAWLEDNWAALGLPPHRNPLSSLLGIPPDALAYRIGRGGGHLLALLQAAAEMVGGAALIVGGAGEFMVGVATTPAGGVGLVVMPVAVVTIAGGATIVVHGGALAGAVFMSAASGSEGGGGGRSEKRDLKQVDDVAKEFKMTKQQREEFGDFLEAEKAAGNGGTANDRGDFTYRELRQMAIEFMASGI